MNTELIKTVETVRAAVKEASVLLRKVAAGDIVEHKAEAEVKVPAIDVERLRGIFEDMAVAHQANTDEIEPAVNAVMQDPNTLLDTIQKLSLHCASLQSAKVAETSPRVVGKLVNKTASAFGTSENKVQKMKRMCQEKARMLP
jgi:hypothetical protein